MGLVHASAVYHWSTILYWCLQSTKEWPNKYGCIDCHGNKYCYFYSVYSVLQAATSPSFESTDFFQTSSMLISFILLGKYLEVLAMGKTSEAIEKLMDLSLGTATLLTLNSDLNVLNEEEIDS